jgi:hypothetical protein
MEEKTSSLVSNEPTILDSLSKSTLLKSALSFVVSVGSDEDTNKNQSDSSSIWY